MRKLLACILVLALLGCALYLVPISFPPLNKAILFALGKRLDAEIDAGSMRLKLFESVSVENVKAVGRGGITVVIKKGRFRYSPVSLFTTGRLEVKCSLEDIAIYEKASILELITDLLYMEYLQDIRFNIVKGAFFIGTEDTITQDLVGSSEEIKFHVDGVTGKDNFINLRLRLLLNDDLTSSIPAEVRNVVLKREEGPWSSIVMGLTGNYKQPSLRLLSKGFRLDISTK